jgi:protein AIR1/2
MANSSDEEADSRTALVGAPRTRANPRSTSRSASNDSNSRPAKRQRRSKNKQDSELVDFLPRGAKFSEQPLPVDPDSTSSSGSSSDSSESSDSDSDAQPATASANPHEGNTTPAISWNQGRKAAVRTTLGKRPAPDPTVIQFTAVNDKYWRSRSESVSSAIPEGEEPQAKKVKANGQNEEEDELEEGEIDSKSESDDSDSLDSEADDSILLNIGDKLDGVDGGNNYDPATLAHQHTSNNTNVNGVSHGSPSKEEAFRQFSRKYPTAPTALIDLNQQDLEIQAHYVHFDKNIHDIDLRLPISCIECQREGHMADICPSKEVCLLILYKWMCV